MNSPRKLSLMAITIAALLVPATGICAEYFQQSVDYTIQVRLDTKNHMLQGAEQIKYTNNSPHGNQYERSFIERRCHP